MMVIMELRREDNGEVVARMVVLDLEFDPAQPEIKTTSMPK
jgi:hypothetical protein